MEQLFSFSSLQTFLTFLTFKIKQEVSAKRTKNKELRSTKTHRRSRHGKENLWAVSEQSCKDYNRNHKSHTKTMLVAQQTGFYKNIWAHCLAACPTTLLFGSLWTFFFCNFFFKIVDKTRLTICWWAFGSTEQLKKSPRCFPREFWTLLQQS